MTTQQFDPSIKGALEAGDKQALARTLMEDYARRTGLAGDAPQARYLWTDAFAVCNLLGLRGVVCEIEARTLARRLVGAVHTVLGHFRDDDYREGWLSGLSEEEGYAFPTKGGLRIGKPLPERAESVPYDADLEWLRDGQYFHYLTQWMHALDTCARTSGEPHFNLWARELAQVAFEGFTYSAPSGVSRMFWKMSTDLSRPLVSSMGLHDPLDGLVTYQNLQSTAREMSVGVGPTLVRETEGFRSMIGTHTFIPTGDPLGIGSLLVDAWRLARTHEHAGRSETSLMRNILEAADSGLERYLALGQNQGLADSRLAFRELGMVIGLHALDELSALRLSSELQPALQSLGAYRYLKHEIESFWTSSEHRQTAAWKNHGNINDVMLATCLDPTGYLEL